MLDLTLRFYYSTKRFLPRRLQLALRRPLVAHKLRKHAALWPINPATAAPPADWTGWPDGKRFALVLTHDVESQRGYELILTARDCFQVCGLADLMALTYRRVGKHYGKNKAMKIAGTVLRSFELSPIILQTRPVLAISQGSRSQMLLAKTLGIPTVLIMEYEHAQSLVGIHPTWIMMPEVIAAASTIADTRQIITYPGIKEDVYVPDFEPNPSILEELEIAEDDLLVTVRPPATEAHYHNPVSEGLFSAAINLLGRKEHVKTLVLPRNERQEAFIKAEWPDLCRNRRLIIPDHVVGGLNLIWFSDLVISSGGTMNREAAPWGSPSTASSAARLARWTATSRKKAA